MIEQLDDLKHIKSVDRSDMLGAIEAFPRHCQEAVELAKATDLCDLADVANAGRINAVLVLGMGGSGIAGDVAKAVLEADLSVPLLVNKGYELPAFVDSGTLVVAVSYSGETEETLTAFEKAVEAGTQAAVITSGGQLAAKAKKLNAPVFMIPAGLQPRAAIAYLVLPLITLMRRIGLAKRNTEDREELITLAEDLVNQYRGARPASENPAKKLAADLYGKIPVIYGSDGITSVAALRWKCQFNENSKSPAFWNVFPELNHNETVGWQELVDISRQFHLVVLRDTGENARVAKRIELTLPLIAGNLGGISEVKSSGESLLMRLFSLIILGDFVSVYLAILYGVDPTPVERIRLLKDKLT
ncbi:MAG: bifunctional phosphoglucose/phosphomannose isomerase [Actinomycetota bacterium]